MSKILFGHGIQYMYVVESVRRGIKYQCDGGVHDIHLFIYCTVCGTHMCTLYTSCNI
jgi:hypothetical protein